MDARLAKLFAHLIVANGLLNTPTDAHADDNSMTSVAKVAQNMQVKVRPQVLMPLSYNYNRNMGNANNINQDEFQFQPFIPVSFGSDFNFILNPMFTGNLNTQNERTNNQAQPFQLATYLTFKGKMVHYGIGPYYQSPALNAQGTPKQSGAGLSYGAYYRPAHWVIGGTGYNAWGIGNNTSSGTANIFSATPLISYTTDNAWTYNLTNSIKYNWNQRRASNQATLSAGKTTLIFNVPIEFQFGPTYMLTSTPASAKGGGLFFKISGSFDSKIK